MSIKLPWDDWKVEKVIGRGSFGTVYLIHKNHLSITESAAVKVLSIPENDEEIENLYRQGLDAQGISAHFRARLEEVVEEYSTMVTLKGHGNIVYCDEIKYTQHPDGIGWDIFIKMELLEPLSKSISTEFHEDEVIHLGKDLCNALIYCHQQGVFHQDIKPQNIFISKVGAYKLGDFGIAQKADATMYAFGVGSPEYMAPEARSYKYDGTLVDVYSLGLVMYWMMNQQRTPFLPLSPQIPTGCDKTRAYSLRMSGKPLPPPSNGSDWLKAIVLKACAFNPADRYSSVQAMLDALNNHSFVPENLDVHKEMTFEHNNHPAGKTISLQIDAKTVQVSVPKDIRSGDTIRVPGKGKRSNLTDAVGDLYFTIHIKDASSNKLYIIIATIAMAVLLLLLIPRNSPNPPEATNPPTSASPPVVQHQHDWKAATYNSPKICTTCGKTEGSKKTPSSRLHLTDIVVDASATSIMPESKDYSYSPDNLYDQDILTYWVEGTSGAGVGEYVTFYFDGTYAINELTIMIGSQYQKKPGYFEKHNRPSNIALYFSDGSYEYIQLDDTREYQTFYFSEYHYADYVELIIEDVYAGTEWNETIIAEVDFAAYLP